MFVCELYRITYIFLDFRRKKHQTTTTWFGEERNEEAQIKQQRNSRVSQALQICEAPEHPNYDWDYLTNPMNRDEIRQNIINRKGIGNIDKLVNFYTSHVLIFLFSTCGFNIQGVPKKRKTF